MEYQFAGRYMWNGMYLDADGDAHQFGVWGDDIFNALANCDSIPGEIIHLERGQDMTEVELPEVPEHIQEAIQKRVKSQLN